ncbi:acetylornithine transaminase [Actinokineospora sp. NBRC 105648]|uniref:acetylornithine transaminase n=1 Tax=Actinokineospora sp. NBRC 105648 TaxID=3032206 RepID=UPI0024A589CE|nr:acetylornithine transaminase [Actinokineospora sp. NBRC 105648]GLZ43645.1 acetylornithine aminotransferase [Actinokineospora sp. NBRC 105648]
MIESNVDGQARWKSALMDNYGTPAIALVRGAGSHVWDADGKRYLDLVGGIATNALGHAHPAVVAAVTEQIGTIAHTSNLYVNPVAVELAEALLDVAGLSGNAKVVFCNSGAEANEAAFKLTRLTGRTKVIATDGAFHGRTMGSLTLTGQPPKRTPFEPLVPGVTHIPFGDVDALRAAVDSDTAALVLEPVLGEGGVVPAPDGYLQAAREITAKAGALLVLDEVQTGVGRLGSWFAFQQAGIVPDVFTLAKGLGGGLPLGACVAVGATADLFAPGHHGTTFGGNAVCAAAGLAVLRTIAADGLLEHVAALGKDLTAAIEQLDHPLVSGVRGTGLLLGVALTAPVSARVAAVAAEAGFLVNNVQPDAVRLAPPLILTEGEADEFVAALPAILDTAQEG